MYAQPTRLKQQRRAIRDAGVPPRNGLSSKGIFFFFLEVGVVFWVGGVGGGRGGWLLSLAPSLLCFLFFPQELWYENWYIKEYHFYLKSNLAIIYIYIYPDDHVCTYSTYMYLYCLFCFPFTPNFHTHTHTHTHTQCTRILYRVY